MGMFTRPSGGSEPSGRTRRVSGGAVVAAAVLPGEPRPSNFHVASRVAVGACLVVEIVYPDCKNFEGRKILVYDDAAKFDELLKAGSVDPHFFEHTYSPAARLEPTPRGRALAVALANTLSILSANGG